jgi:hypothetical protein
MKTNLSVRITAISESEVSATDLRLPQFVSGHLGLGPIRRTAKGHTGWVCPHRQHSHLHNILKPASTLADKALRSTSVVFT